MLAWLVAGLVAWLVGAGITAGILGRSIRLADQHSTYGR